MNFRRFLVDLVDFFPSGQVQTSWIPLFYGLYTKLSSRVLV